MAKKLSDYHNIAFIGGIHGTGKGIICSQIAEKLDVQHISASEILKWEEVSPDTNNKLVANIPDTQDRLIMGLNEQVVSEKYYLLDGHFCLLNSEGNVDRIPVSTFEQISPVVLAIVVCDILEIKEHLKTRDGKHYDFELLKNMQEMEVKYAKEIASFLGIELITLDSNKVELLNLQIKQTFHL